MTDGPGPMPEPEPESPEIEPGGVDAVEQPDYGEEDGPWTRDLPTEDNPAVQDNVGREVGDDISEPEDKKQEGEGSEPQEDDTTGEPSA